ncbi:hypothetical protein BBJ28_00013949 [Nothophytophthora sp. Chile5]|nr:hypothetical protein BBJ28_00013949 [Nothophytophthora sp. Chile5]
MDVWGTQDTTAGEQAAGEEEEWELAESGKDALIVLLDVRAAMFAPYPHAAAGAPSTWFHAVVELVIKLLKSKVIASDNSLLSVVFFGTVGELRIQPRSLNVWHLHVFEFQPLGYPSAQRIKDLQVRACVRSLGAAYVCAYSNHLMLWSLDQALLDTDVQSAYQSMDNSDQLAFSNALWQCGIAFSNAK